MFWSIFLQSAAAIIVILLIGQGVAALIEKVTEED